MHRRQTLHPRRLRRTHGADEGAAQGPWRAQTGRFKAGYMGKPWKSTTNRDTKVNFTKGYKLILTSQNFSLFVSMGISTFTSKEFVIFCRVSKIGNGLNRDLSSTHSRLVVSNIFGIFQNIWDNPSHWLLFFKMVKTTKQIMFSSGPPPCRFCFQLFPWNGGELQRCTAFSITRRHTTWRFFFDALAFQKHRKLVIWPRKIGIQGDL